MKLYINLGHSTSFLNNIVRAAALGFKVFGFVIIASEQLFIKNSCRLEFGFFHHRNGG